MFRYGKLVQNAVAVVSRLAEIHGREGRLGSSLEIAKARNLPKPIVAKVLTIMARNGLVVGSPGPGGGYRLARAPREITLHDLVQLFETTPNPRACPLGPGCCGKGEPCGFHEKFETLQRRNQEFLRKTHFGVFKSKLD